MKTTVLFLGYFSGLIVGGLIITGVLMRAYTPQLKAPWSTDYDLWILTVSWFLIAICGRARHPNRVTVAPKIIPATS